MLAATTTGSRTANVDFFQVSVTYATAPVITSNGGGATAAITVNENTTAVTTVTSTGDTTRTYSISGGADAAKFSINSSSGVLTFAAAPNFEIPTDVGTNNVYEVTVQAAIGALADTQAIAVTVANVVEPLAITSNGGGTTAAVSVPENTTAVTTVVATAEGAITYSITGGADQAQFSLNSSSGVLTFNTAPNFENKTDVGNNGVYDVTVQAAAGAETDTQAIAVTVTNVNEAPVITESDPQTLTTGEDVQATLTLNATDVDAATSLTWSILTQATNGVASVPAGAGASKVVTYVPNGNYAGSDSFVVRVSDGALTDTVTVNVTVTPVADTYYVDKTQPDASDANAGTNPDLPLLTISRGAFLARAGDTVRVLAGTYAETVWLDQYSGIDGSPITFEAASADVVVSGNGSVTNGAAFYVVQRGYIVIDGFRIEGTAFKGIFAVESNHLTIKNTTITDAGQHVWGEHQQGIHFKTVTDSLIDNNLTYDNSCIGIRLTHASNNNVVSNNVSYGNYSAVNPGEVTDAAGIELDDSDNNLVIHNTVYANEDSGINVYHTTAGDGSQNNKVIGNLSYSNGDHGIDNNGSTGQIIVGNTVYGNYTSGINLEASSSGATVANNIVANNGLNPADGRKPGNIYVDDTSVAGTSLDYNLYYRSGGTTQIKWNTTGFATLADFKASVPSQEAHGLEGNPQFVSTSPTATVSQTVLSPIVVGDYHLQPGSPAIDSANSSAPNNFFTDMDGVDRVDDPAVANTGAGTRAYDDRGAFERKPPITTSLVVQPVTVTYGNAINMTATLSPALSGKTISFTLNGAAACTGVTNGSGVASCSSALVIDAGVYAAGIGASFAGELLYAPSNNTAALTVTQRALTVSATADNKIYDGGTTATIALTDNRLSGDVLTVGFSGAAFADKNVGVGKTVTVSGININGADAANYTVNATATATADIAAKSLTVTAVGVDKVYDGTTVAAVLLNDTRISGDALTVGVSAAFTDKVVGNAKPIAVTSISITGADASNYTLSNTSATTLANITPRALLVSATGNDKVYDGNTAATVNLVFTALTGDAVTPDYDDATFNNKNVGAGKTVTVTGISITGADAGNYSVNATTTTTADITPLALTVSASAEDKVYDGNTTATVELSLTALTGDVVTPDYDDATFNNKNVGAGKVVTVTGISITGADAGNYSVNTTAATTAEITVLHITGAFTASDKVFDGTADATVLTRTLVGKIAADDVSLTGGTATFADAAIGLDKVVTLTGAALSGVDAGNYALDSVATTTASIYAQFGMTDLFLEKAMAEAGPFSPISGALGGGFTTILNPANAYYYINVANLATNRELADGLYPFTVSAYPAGYFEYWATRGVVDGATGWQGVMWDIINGDAPIFYLKVVGEDYTLVDGLTYLTGGGEHLLRVNGDYHLGVYTFSGELTDVLGYTANASVTIEFVTPQTLTVSGLTANDKEYDGTTDVTFDDTLAGLVGVMEGDDVALDLTGIAGAFADKNVGADKDVPVTGLTLTGANADDYVLTQPTLKADITPKMLAVTGITAEDKIYDGSDTATLNADAAVLSSAIGSEEVTLNKDGATGAFDDKNVGVGKTVTVSGLALEGADAGNYALEATTATADITPLDLTVTAAGVNKVYDGGTNATVTLTDDRVSGDMLTVTYASATFADANVGNGIAVAVSGIAMSGTDAGNYTLLNTTADTTANITPKPITVTADSNQVKRNGETDPVFTYTYTPNIPVVAFTGALSREPGEANGEYDITIGTLSAGDNYTISFVSAKFTIISALPSSYSIFLPILSK